MFILGRRVGERIIITVPPSSVPREISVRLICGGPEKAKLGFEADRNGEMIRIDREEIHLARKAAAARDARNAHITGGQQ
jgi:sRNA-binding carbon storage regulator CsrA